MKSARAGQLAYLGATGLAVVAFLLATHHAWPDPSERAVAQYRLVIAMGYGHLIGAVAFASHRLRNWVPAGVPEGLFWSFLLVGVAVAFSAYAVAVANHPQLVVVMLAVSIWHIVENDEAIRRSLRKGVAIGPLPRSGSRQLEVLGVTCLMVALSQSLLPEEARVGGLWQEPVAAVLRGLAGMGGVALIVRRRVASGAIIVGAALGLPHLLPFLDWVHFSDFFSSVTLFHLFGWLLVLARRARLEGPTASARLRFRPLQVHAIPAAVCAITLASETVWMVNLRDLLFSPGIYLFWSVLHVVQTACVRGIGPGRSWAPAGQAAG